ncbi:helicase SNF [Paenibacillus sp. CAA11]|uniref:DEAD/DEAH box helicase n=1 Tax=Paenibacillus sp. CAA11 TaxID=1532905 RepID=UPI000D392165|nr:DEAD/DEAH box helicase [Paenibacillus sp. CAA11]AWB45729.1 helicase SNF [Paenibacillus sp. CAA11]
MELYSLWTVEALCGTESFKVGKEYFRQGRVMDLSMNMSNHYEAVVQGSRSYRVTVKLDQGGHPEAVCECPAYHAQFQYCEHIAAVLIAIHEKPEPSISGVRGTFSISESHSHYQGNPLSAREERTANELIRLFEGAKRSGGPPLRERVYVQTGQEKLQVEWICTVEEGLYSDANPKITVSVKVGLKRTYVVQDIRLFLEHAEKGRALPFSSRFQYDPALHTFGPEDRKVLEQLCRVLSSEQIYAADGNLRTGSRSSGLQKYLTIPPLAWGELLPALIAAGATIEQPGGFTASLALYEGTPPVSYELGRQDAYFYLQIQGLEETILMPKYGCAISRGTVFRMEQSQLELLSEIKDTIYRGGLDGRLSMAAQQLDEFIRQALPKLRALGQVRLDPEIQSRILSPKLAAKLFLDRLDEELILKLEFHYDGIIILPLEAQERQLENQDSSILIREMDREKYVLNVIEELKLPIRGTAWVTDQEEQIYNVLFHLLPQLEGKAEVFATTAVRDWVYPDSGGFETLADADASLNWLEITFSMDGIGEAEIRKILLSVLERRKYYRLKSGAFYSLEGKVFQTFAGMAEDLGVSKNDIGHGRITLPLVRSLLLTESGDGGPRLGRSLRRFLEQVRDPDMTEAEVPARLASVLRDYQKRGFRWLKTLARYRFGGILADDMGLGKTLQSIAYIVSEWEETEEISGDGRLPVLIVAPASLVYNWENEFKKFAPELQVRVAAGSKQERTHQAAAEADVIITSYPALRRDSDIYDNMKFSTMILDEAQAFKNHTTQTAMSVKRIQAGRRFALTGTPIENSLDELWSIFDVIFPGLFTGRQAFKDMPRDTLARLVRPFILRRLKSQVLRELPEKIETVCQSELTSEQKKLYAAYLSSFKKQTLKDLESEGFQKSRMKILAGITRLRQICCHPSLFEASYQGSSGKLEQLSEIVEECLASGKRLLIFSQFTGMLQMIRGELTQRNIPTFYLDGQTPSRERVELCSRFNDGENDIFLISLKAGGTGLNLTGADTVVLYDLWWNPAVEEQAAGRAHRLGQKRTVQIIRLIAQGTIEDKMLELQQRKRNLIHEVIDAEESELAVWSEQDIRDLLMISPEG